MVGEKPKYDVFLSYRVQTDAQHAEKLYNLLTTAGLSVWWDRMCILPGEIGRNRFVEVLFRVKSSFAVYQKTASQISLVYRNLKGMGRKILVQLTLNLISHLAPVYLMW